VPGTPRLLSRFCDPSASFWAQIAPITVNPAVQESPNAELEVEGSTDVCFCAQEYLMLEFSQCPSDVLEQLGARNTLILLDEIVSQRRAHGLGI
jgi:hypothetical protein